MIMGGFSGWIGIYALAYIFVMPLLNVIYLPILLIGLYRGRFNVTAWRKGLLLNGFFSVFGLLIPYLEAIELMKSFERNDVFWLKNGEQLYLGLGFYMSFLGLLFQACFYIVWIFFFFRKKELPPYFYKAWSWSFILLYLFPNALFFAWLIGSSLNV